MVKLLIIAIFAMVRQQTVSCTGTYHTCDKTHAESAGVSGTVDVKGNCRLNLTVGTNKLSIFGAGTLSSCDDSAKFMINSKPYCANASLNTLINISGNEVVITAEEEQLFEIQYYRGKL